MSMITYFDAPVLRPLCLSVLLIALKYYFSDSVWTKILGYVMRSKQKMNISKLEINISNPEVSIAYNLKEHVWMRNRNVLTGNEHVYAGNEHVRTGNICGCFERWTGSKYFLTGRGYDTACSMFYLSKHEEVGPAAHVELVSQLLLPRAVHLHTRQVAITIVSHRLGVVN